MKFSLGLAGVWLTLAAPGAQAGFQEIAGISCQGGELTVVTGAAFSASCGGDLRVGAFSVIRAEESIHLTAAGNAGIWGRLDAPRIVIVAGIAVHVGEGAVLVLDGGVMDASGPLRDAGGVLTVAGADVVDLRLTAGRIALSPDSPAVAVPGGTVFAVPQPATILLMAAGAAAMFRLRRPRREKPQGGNPFPPQRKPRLAWRHKPASMSRTAHAPNNRNVTFEN